MARADQLLAGMLTAMRREDELLATLLDDLQSEDSSDDEDEVEEMWIVQDLLTGVCALDRESLKGIARTKGIVCKKVLCVKGIMSRSVG